MKKYRKISHGHDLFTMPSNKNEISGKKKPIQGSEEPL